MNVKLAGLPNLAQTLKPQAAAKGSSSKDAKKASTFEDILGKEKSLREATTPDRSLKNEIEARTRKPETDAVENRRPELDRSDRDSNIVESESLEPGTPGQGLPSNINSPLNDRAAIPGVPMGQNTAKAALFGKGSEEAVGVDSLTRRVVWNDFLRKMRDEFGVSAEDVLQAFGSLSDEELAQPPSESVDKVVMALGLSDQQSVLAKQYFQDLISRTQSHSLGQELSDSSKQINLSLMTERELQRKAMDRSLMRMNSNFFMNGPGARPMAQAPNMETSIAPNSVKLSEREVIPSEKTQAEAPALATLTPDFATPPDQAPLPAALNKGPVSAKQRELDELTAQMQPVDSQNKSVEQLVQKFMQSQAPIGAAKGMPASAVAAPVLEAPVANAAANAAPAAPAVSANALNGLLAALDADSSSGDEASQEFSDASYLNTPLAGSNSKLDAPLASAQDFQSALGQVKPGAPMSVPDLVQQAQVMVRDGGGEMKVTLNQEGLGEVAMRVSVDQGKVNVQMITESDEAKKLIERGLSELKHSLSANHLQVNDIKIDTASNLGQQLEQQYQDAQRQQAQNSWEQFRQDNQRWRQNFFETASAREYKGQADAPRDVTAPSGSGSARRTGAHRLNLVA